MATMTPKKSDFNAGLDQADRIINLIDTLDDSKWDRPWFVSQHKNPLTDTTYRGTNVLELEFHAARHGYESPYWITYNQMEKLGGSFIGDAKGKSAVIIYWKPFLAEDKTKNKVNGQYPKKLVYPKAPRYYRVFNIEEITGIELDLPKNEWEEFEPSDIPKEILKLYKQRPLVVHGDNKACYYPQLDQVNMPKVKDFRSDADYCCTLFHELVHSTGHKSRLDRLDSIDSTSKLDDYAKEELVAELGASMICGITGITGTESNNAAYLKNWLGKLKDDKNLLIRASRDAQKAIDRILGTEFAEGEED
jgi:antirestriction protein ArdC